MYTYYSDLVKPMDNYKVQELYATCDQDYTTVDGSMYFLPKDAADVVLNQGIVTDGLKGEIEIRSPVQYDIKGLTVEFGKAYPVEFTIISDNRTLNVTNNADGHYVTEEIFEGATFLRFVPAAMVNGQSRFRINQITMGLLFLQLMHYTDKISHTSEGFDQRLIFQVLGYIDENYRDGELTELSSMLGYDIYWLSRMVKRLTGRTYKELLQIKRLNQAAFLLLNTRLAVADGALAVGYDNTSYFYRIFKERYQMSPKEYRKNNRAL